MPYGHKQQLMIPSLSALVEYSGVLSKTDLSDKPYDDAVSSAHSGDVVYLDPPYPPLNGTAFFTHYTKERFVHGDQIELAGVAADLGKRGCLVVMSNADTPEIRDLYKEWRIQSLPVSRVVTCKSKVHSVQELIIRNY